LLSDHIDEGFSLHRSEFTAVSTLVTYCPACEAELDKRLSGAAISREQIVGTWRDSGGGIHEFEPDSTFHFRNSSFSSTGTWRFNPRVRGQLEIDLHRKGWLPSHVLITSAGRDSLKVWYAEEAESDRWTRLR
jgi:hypothetical protein